MHTIKVPAGGEQGPEEFNVGPLVQGTPLEVLPRLDTVVVDAPDPLTLDIPSSQVVNDYQNYFNRDRFVIDEPLTRHLHEGGLNQQLNAENERPDRSVNDIILDFKKSHKPTAEEVVKITRPNHKIQEPELVEFDADKSKISEFIGELAEKLAVDSASGRIRRSTQALLSETYRKAKFTPEEKAEFNQDFFKALADLKAGKTTKPSEAVFAKEDKNKFGTKEGLKEARERLAKNTIKRRGGAFDTTEKDADVAQYGNLLSIYTANYNRVVEKRVKYLRSVGKSEEEIAQTIAVDIQREMLVLSKAEIAAYDELNPKIGKAALAYSKMGLGKKMLTNLGVSGVTGVTGAAVGLGLAATGVGIPLVAAGAALSLRAGKTVGMHKVKNKARNLTQFEHKAEKDAENAAKQIGESSHSDIAQAASEALYDSIDARVKRDRRENKRAAIAAVIAIPAGALAGALAGGYVKDHAKELFGKAKELFSKPKATHEIGRISLGRTVEVVKSPTDGPVPPRVFERETVTKPTIVTNDHLEYLNREPSLSRPESVRVNESILQPVGNQPAVTNPVDVAHEVIPTPAAEATPTAPIVEAPVFIQPQIEVKDYTWNVAHQFAPGNETLAMQNGINAYNAMYGTNLALTPHNGDMWIMDGNRALNWDETIKLNKLVLGITDDEEFALAA